ncbi:transmembrane and ubiquitin-like domain-containing protein 1 isoform X2 [Dendropsophus ebraccatus]
MALIEGVGDEVTLLCASLLLLSVVVLAWISTHTAERGSASQTHEANSAPAGHGSDQDLRPPESGVDHLSSHIPPAPDESHPAASENNGNSSISPDTSPIAGGPSPRSDPDSNRECPTVRHRGPQTHGAPVRSADTITLRLKFLNETERVVNVRLTDSVLNIKRSQFPGQESRVRLIYQGQLLRDDGQTVGGLQLSDGCVLHCHLSQHASAAAAGGGEPALEAVNIGSLLLPLLLLLLGGGWCCHFQYPQLFTNTATACLAAMTLFVLVLVFSAYRR